MGFGIEKCAIEILRSGNQKKIEGIELPNKKQLKTLGKNGTYKYLVMLESDSIKQAEMKENIKIEYIKRMRKLFETKEYNRNLIKGIKTRDVHLVRYSGPIFETNDDESSLHP